MRVALALLSAGALLFVLAAPSAGDRDRVLAQAPDADTERAPLPEDRAPLARTPATEADRRLVREGRRLFVDGCSTCHGFDARGIADRAPSLHGVGALAADFYLRTGRMPLEDPEDEPRRRKDSFYTAAQRQAIVAYVGSLGGPPIPVPHPERGRLSEGAHLFAVTCAGCHQIVARGGIAPHAVVPDLEGVKAIDVYEAIQIGPYVMPKFAYLTPAERDSIARYVLWTQDPTDLGGWGIGHIGPIPEGMVTLFIGLFALLFTIRAIGERTTE
ncbi:MAG TPA: c-type cytochrome [Solirubrobacteraceae bacterium]|nr:c-type cytochrome [Solirubrobacteraceae bacterium]